jgi:hypothetical protein
VRIIAIYIELHQAIFDTFITKLDAILKKLFIVTVYFTVCDDLNINDLVDSDRRSQLEALLQSYNLTNVVNFPTRILHNTATSIDNNFIDVTKGGNYSVLGFQIVMPRHSYYTLLD